MGDSYITWEILIWYGGFPYNMGDSSIVIGDKKKMRGSL